MPRSAVEVFQQNVNALIENYRASRSPRLSYGQVAHDLQISLRNLTNLRKAEHAATLDTVQQISSFFELEPWQLFMEDLPTELLLNPRLARLVRSVVRLAVQERVADEYEKTKRAVSTR